MFVLINSMLDPTIKDRILFLKVESKALYFLLLFYQLQGLEGIFPHVRKNIYYQLHKLMVVRRIHP